jgi:hypothetical protein
MYARVTYVQAPEGKVNEGLKLWRENVLPITKSREGFRGVVSLVQRETGKALSITLWDMELQLLDSTEAEYHKQALERYGEYFEGVHDPENFEIDFLEGPVFELEGQTLMSSTERASAS